MTDVREPDAGRDNAQDAVECFVADREALAQADPRLRDQRRACSGRAPTGGGAMNVVNARDVVDLHAVEDAQRQDVTLVTGERGPRFPKCLGELLGVQRAHVLELRIRAARGEELADLDISAHHPFVVDREADDRGAHECRERTATAIARECPLDDQLRATALHGFVDRVRLVAERGEMNARFGEWTGLELCERRGVLREAGCGEGQIRFHTASITRAVDPRQSGVARGTVICPSDEALSAWSAGELAGAEREQIEDHAATCAACRGLVSAIAGVMTRTFAPGIGAEGAMIDRYRIVGSAGHGAMGVVLRAHDPVLDREVAIKMVNSAAEDATARARMLAEAQTLARIDHPNVVRVYDAGIVGDEVFVAMAFVDGPTLAQWKGSRAESKRVLITVGAGICAVHAVGLVHRDIKPDNIIVSHGEGVLVDLGLAKALVGGLGSGHAGTENYIAPEIRAGKGASPASDQYAWWRVVQETLPDPALKDVLARGLADDPSKRFPTLVAAIAAFDRALTPRRRWPYALGTIAIAVGIGFALRSSPAVDACARVAPMQWTIDRPVILANAALLDIDPKPLATALDARAARFAALSSETCREEPTNHAHALREQLCLEETWRESAQIFPGLATPEPRTVHLAIDDLALVLPLDRCASGVVPAVPAPPTAAQQAEALALQTAIRDIHMQRRTPPRQQLAALHALEPRIAALGYPPTTEHLHMTLAELLHRAGKDDDADRELASVVAMAEAAGDDDTRTRALIDVYRQDFLHGAHPAAAANAEAAAARLGNPGITAELEMSRGLSDVSRGDNAGALKAFTEAANLLDSVAIGANAEMVNAAQNLAGLQEGAAQLATYDRGLALARARYGLDDPNTLQMRGARATALIYQNKPRDARPELVAVAAGLQKLVGDAPPVAQAKSYICEVDLALEDRVAAKQSCDAALALSQAIYPPNDPQLAWPLTLVGHQRVDAGELAAAVAPLEQALLATAKNTAMPTDRGSAQAWLALALAKKDPLRAAKLAREARAALEGTPSAAQLLAKLAASERP